MFTTLSNILLIYSPNYCLKMSKHTNSMSIHTKFTKNIYYLCYNTDNNITWSPVDCSKRSQDTEYTKNFQKADTRTAKNGYQRYRDNHDIQTVESLDR